MKRHLSCLTGMNRLPSCLTGMKRSLSFLTAALIVAGGCKGIDIHTKSSVRMNPPMAGPVVAQSVQRGVCPEACAPKVALIDVDGVLLNVEVPGLFYGENAVAIFREKLDAAAADPGVRGVVLRINSPGGGVTACDIMRHELLRYKQRTCKPVAVCVLDTGAGGAYYLATAGDRIFAHPTSLVGGIGVILNVYNLSDSLGQFNVRPTPIKSGEHIDMGTPIVGLDDAQKKMLSDMADEFHDRFKQVVRETRPLPPGSEEKLFDGRVLSATRGVESGLIDQLGYLDEAVDWVRQAGGAPNAPVVAYRRDNERIYSPYATSPPHSSLKEGLFPFSVPGLDRAKLPTFLYLWQPEPTLERK